MNETYRDLYLEAHDRADADRAFVPHEHIAAIFEDAGWGELVDRLGGLSSWTVWTPESRETSLYAYTPDLAGDTSGNRERLVKLLEAANAETGTDRFIDVLDGQNASFDTGNARPTDDPELSGNYGVKGGRGGNGDGAWLVDIDVDDYDDAKKANLRVQELRGETLAVASAHTTADRPGHLYVLVDGDPRAVVREFLHRDIDNVNASFGEIRVSNQYVVGPGSEIVCGCPRCTDENDPDHFGRYELANERPPVVWSEDEFRTFLEADPALDRRADQRPAGDDTTAGGSGLSSSADVTLSGDPNARLQLAKAADDYVGDALREATNPDDRSAADAALARSVAPWLNYDRTAIEDVLDDYGTSKWVARTDDSYRGSVLGYALDRKTQVDGYDVVPYWAVVEFALTRGTIDRDDVVRRESDSGAVVDEDVDADTYRAFPDVATYRDALKAIEELGVDHGREPPALGRTHGGRPPEVLKGLAITLDPEVAWRAAGAVNRDDLEVPIDLPTDDGGEGWVSLFRISHGRGLSPDLNGSGPQMTSPRW